MKHKLLTPLMLFIAATVFLAACASDETGVSTSGSPDEADLPADVDLPADSTGDVPLTSDAVPTEDADPPDTTEVPDQDLPVKSDDVDESTTVPPGEVLGAGPYPVATLDITISHPDAADVSYTISCLGDTATVIGDVGIDERVACERLADAAVRTRLVEGVPKDQICTEQYGGPDLAKIVGTYDGVDGVAVATTIDRVNGCGIGDWDVLLAGVLPGAKGI